MKKIIIAFASLFLSIIISYKTFAQSSMSEIDKQLIIEQVKKDVMDSLRSAPKNNATNFFDNIKISGYVETYYGYDFGNPLNHTRPSYVYSHNRTNEVNLNLGLIKFAYANQNTRGNVALMAGTYANANLAAEPNTLKNIYEANAGFKISKKKNIWIDAGILPSHIGFESAIGKDCWSLTRSMLADNSPYFETGAKISYNSNNEKLFLSVLVLNGWQRIQRVDGNNMPAFGHQLTYKPNANLTFNSSSFIGSDSPDSTRQIRYFHNFYSILQLNKNFGVTVGFDIGAQQKSKGSNDYFSWYSPVLIAKYSPTEKISLAARGEYYSDANGVIISSVNPNGFNAWSYSFNVDYAINSNLLWRIEAKGYNSKDKVFLKNDLPSSNNYLLSTALAMSF